MFKKVSILISLLAIHSIIAYCQIPTDYYKGSEELTGTELVNFLRTVINEDFEGVNYGDSRYILDETDADPEISGNLILVYLGLSVSGEWDSGITWNREHVWPQSLLNVDVSNSTISVGSDLHNLKPADPNENSSRGNDYYDDQSGTGAYEPRDVVKGDLARILFYMTVMYNYLELTNGVPQVYQMGKLDVLLNWHQSDPVDDFERNRNEVIYSYQNNRNPFIDHPEFVEKIWNTTSITLNKASGVYLYPNPAHSYLIISDIESYTTFKIFNVIGKSIRQGNVTAKTLPLEGVSKGKYILQLSGTNSFVNIPFIVN